MNSVHNSLKVLKNIGLHKERIWLMDHLIIRDRK